MIPGKRTVPDPNGGEGAAKEESILTVDYWPDPWTIEKTDPALRVRSVSLREHRRRHPALRQRQQTVD